MPPQYKALRRRDVPLGKRDRTALNALDVICLKNNNATMENLVTLMEQTPDADEDAMAVNIALAAELQEMYKEVATVQPGRERPPRQLRVSKTIADFEAMEGESEFEFSTYFRFKNGDQLRRLIRGFQFPDVAVVYGHK